MDSLKKYTKQTKQVKLTFRSAIFPFVTKFMDRRLESYLSLFYECDNYSLEELKFDLCEVLYTRQPFSVMPFPERKPVYTQLTLF